MQSDPYDKEPYTPEAAYAAPPPREPAEPAAAPVAAPPPEPAATFDPPPEPRPLAPAVAAAHVERPEPAASPAPASPFTEGAWWSDRAQLRQWAFLGGLLGGVLILLGAFVLALFVTVFHLMDAGNPNVWFLDEDAFPGVALAVALWGLVAGGLVLLGALRLKESAERTAVPGGMMLLGGLLSFFALGGFLVGGLAAILAGVASIAGAERVLPERAERPQRRAPGALP